MVIYLSLILRKKALALDALCLRNRLMRITVVLREFFSPVAGILGSLQANEVLKTILNFKDNFDNQMMIFDAIKNNFRTVRLSCSPKCKNKCSK